MENVEKGLVRQCWRHLFSLMVLNLLTLAGCLPILTIPAALTALSRSCQDLLLEKPRPIRGFWRTFRTHLLPALPLGLLFPLTPAAALYGCLFYVQNAGNRPWLLIPGIFCLLVGCLAVFTSGLAYPMLARADLSARAVLRNSFLLLFRGCGFGTLLLSALLGAGMVLLFPHSLPALVLLGASLPAFTAAYGTLPALDALVVKKARE